MRAHEYNVYQDIVARMHALFQKLEQRYRCTIELDFSAYYPSLINDAAIHEKLKPVQNNSLVKTTLSLVLAIW